MRNSEIMICNNINIDKDYRNVLNYNQNSMLNLCKNNTIARQNNYSFIRDTGRIRTNFKYSDCLMSNYMAFQNKDYSNKWFFAWITKVNYISDSTTEIEFQIDAWSTWYNDWQQQKCFVIREHVNSDNYYEHLIPESFECGDYINNYGSTFTNLADCVLVMGSSINPSDGESAVGGGVYGGIYSGIKYYCFNSNDNLNNAIVRIAKKGKTSGINCIFLAPKWLVKYDTITFDTNGVGEITYTFSTVTSQGIAIPLHPTQIDGYTPKNKKLFNYPWCYYNLSNNGGQNAILKLENFYNSGNNLAYIKIIGTITPGCSIRAIPLGYRKISELSEDEINDEGISCAKFPVCNFTNDVYTNWLTLNGLSRALDTTRNITDTITSSASQFANKDYISGSLSLFKGGLNIADSLIEKYQHSLIPPQVEGNINCGDVNYSNNKITFSGYFNSIKSDFAKSIDDYFTRFGYKVNKLKIPNIVGRPIYNYIQIADGEEIGQGNVPITFMEIINNIARRGTTIWHNHENIGNYNLDNSITTN